MSERDHRYNPYKLLPNASIEDCTNDSEKIALLEFQELFKKRSTIQHTLDYLSSKSSESDDSLDMNSSATMQINQQLVFFEEELKAINKQLNELGWSDVLRDVLRKKYREVCAEDHKRFIVEQERKRAEIFEESRKRPEEAGRTIKEYRNLYSIKVDNSVVSSTQNSTIVQQPHTKSSTSPFILTNAEKMKPKVFRAFIVAVLGIFLFYLSYTIFYLIIGGIILLLSELPLIGGLIDWFFTLRGDTPDMMLSMIIPAISYLTVMLLQEKTNKHNSTRGLSCKILGVCLIVLNVVSLVLNLFYGEGILKNVIQIITGIIFYSSGKNILEDEVSNN